MEGLSGDGSRGLSAAWVRRLEVLEVLSCGGLIGGFLTSRRGGIELGLEVPLPCPFGGGPALVSCLGLLRGCCPVGLGSGSGRG